MCRAYRKVASLQWEHTRLISYTIAAANRDPKKPFPSIDKYLPLPTDTDQVKSMEDELNETRRKWVEYYNKTYGLNLA